MLSPSTWVILQLLLLLSVSLDVSNGLRLASWRSRTLKLAAADNSVDVPEFHVSFGRIAVSGLVSQRGDFSQSAVFSMLQRNGAAMRLACLCDDIKFAKKRFLSPETVYSGLVDMIDFCRVDEIELVSFQSALLGCDAWMAFNVSSRILNQFVDLIEKTNLTRVVIGVPVSDLRDEEFSNQLISSAVERLKGCPNLNFTFLKYDSDFCSLGEAINSYRITEGVNPIPRPAAESNFNRLSMGDIFRVFAEIVDHAMTFGKVYGIGAGSLFDSEALKFMRGQGWSERAQAGILLDGIVSRIEQKSIDFQFTGNKNKKSKETVRLKSVNDLKKHCY